MRFWLTYMYINCTVYAYNYCTIYDIFKDYYHPFLAIGSCIREGVGGGGEGGIDQWMKNHMED